MFDAPANEETQSSSAHLASPDVVYTKRQMNEIIKNAVNLFDVVRLVDPLNMVVYAIEDGEFRVQKDSCYHVWNKQDRCENCISARCFMDKKRYSKFEFIDHDAYHVVAQVVNVEGREFVLEVVTASYDDVLLSAFGDNDFVEQITHFNHKVYTDELTGLSNRRFMNDRLSIMVGRATHAGDSLAVAMVDIDDFKLVNDSFGHLAGDKALKEAASAIEEGFAHIKEDIVVRYGGDEFFLAAQGITRSDLEERLEKVEALAVDNDFGFTLSIGAAYLPEAQGETIEDLIHKADGAMYEAKAAGKGRIVIR